MGAHRGRIRRARSVQLGDEGGRGRGQSGGGRTQAGGESQGRKKQEAGKERGGRLGRTLGCDRGPQRESVTEKEGREEEMSNVSDVSDVQGHVVVTTRAFHRCMHRAPLQQAGWQASELCTDYSAGSSRSRKGSLGRLPWRVPFSERVPSGLGDVYQLARKVLARQCVDCPKKK